MTSGRSFLAEALNVALPGWQIVSSARSIDTVRKPGACVLWTEKREKAPALGLGWFWDRITLVVLTAADKADVVEDDLDDLLLTVCQALEPLEAFHWDTAERVSLDGKFPGYQLTVTCGVNVTPEPDPETF